MERPLANRGAVATLGAELPPLEGLVEKVPAAVREALDDLFRARFTLVRRFTGAGDGAPP